MEMLFIFCTWHAYAKLRLHTSSTLEALGKTTRALGASLREFVKVICSCYATKELPREEAARVRRRANASAKGKGKATVTSDKPKFSMWALQHVYVQTSCSRRLCCEYPVVWTNR
jgi:hypothetical protein